MAQSAWRVWGMSVVLAGGLVVLGQSPKSEITGRTTPQITQDHFQPEAGPPKVLPQQVRQASTSKTAPPTARDFTANVIGLQAPSLPAPDLDVPIRATSIGRTVPPFQTGGLSLDWKARAALDIADMHFDACELDDARDWYQEVINLGPGSSHAAMAAERLDQIMALSPAVQSSEPPLAIAAPPTLQVRIP